MEPAVWQEPTGSQGVSLDTQNRCPISPQMVHGVLLLLGQEALLSQPLPLPSVLCREACSVSEVPVGFSFLPSPRQLKLLAYGAPRPRRASASAGWS